MKELDKDRIILRPENFPNYGRKVKGNPNYHNKAQCIVCGKTIEPLEAYCEEHKYLAEEDNEKLKNASNTDFAMLAAAVIDDFMRDYRLKLKALYDEPFDKLKLERVLKAQRYIRSKDFEMLSVGLADPEKVIEWTRERVKEEREQARIAKIQEEAKKITKELAEQVRDLKREVNDLRKELDEIKQN